MATHMAANVDISNLGLLAINKLRAFSVEQLQLSATLPPYTQLFDVFTTHMKLLRVLAEGGVILLHKIPANLVLGEVGVGSAGSRSLHPIRGGGLAGHRRNRMVSVGRHDN